MQSTLRTPRWSLSRDSLLMLVSLILLWLELKVLAKNVCLNL